MCVTFFLEILLDISVFDLFNGVLLEPVSHIYILLL